MRTVLPGPSEHIIIQATHSHYTITANRLQLRHTQRKHTSTALRNDLLALSVTVTNVFNLSLWSRLELYGNLQLSSQIRFRDFRCSVVACILFFVVHFQSICFSICTTDGIFGLNYKRSFFRYFGLWKSHVYSSRRFDMTICKLYFQKHTLTRFSDLKAQFESVYPSKKMICRFLNESIHKYVL